MAKPILSQKYVKSRFEYKDGNLYHKPMTKDSIRKNQWNTRFAGKIAGSVNSHGYMQCCLSIDGKRYNYTIHRLIFIYHNGYSPDHVDHIDGNPLNNCIKNLREASNRINQRNAKKPKTNTSGTPGVYKTENGTWRVRVRDMTGKNLSIGTFQNKEDAIRARKQAEMKYGYHPNYGR
jgi:hypothetical protein